MMRDWSPASSSIDFSPINKAPSIEKPKLQTKSSFSNLPSKFSHHNGHHMHLKPRRINVI